MKKTKTSKPEAEVALVTALIANQRDAWRTLLAEYGSAMRMAAGRVVRRVARHLPSDFASDIQQQVFVNLLQNDKHALRAFDPALGSLRTYLSRIATNLAHDELARFLRCGAPLDLDDVIAREARGDEDDGGEPHSDGPSPVDLTFFVGARRAIAAARKQAVRS